MTPQSVAPAETSAALSLEAMIPSLHRLDQLLANAIKSAETVYGSKAAADPYRGLYVSNEDTERLLAREPGAPLFTKDPGLQQARPRSDSPLERMQRQFGLTDFDMDVILLTLATEIDLRYERLYSYLQDDVTRRKPSVDLALNLLCESRETRWTQRARFASDAPLVRHRLLTTIPDPSQTQPSLLSHFLKLDESVVWVLMGQPGLDSRLTSFCEWKSPEPGTASIAPAPSETQQTLEKLAEESADKGTPLRLYFRGPAGAGQATAVDAIARKLNRKVLAVDLGRLAGSGPEVEASLALVLRDALLLDAIPYLEDLDALRAEDRVATLDSVWSRVVAAGGVVILTGTLACPSTWTGELIVVPFAILDFAGRRQTWQDRLATSGISATDDDLDGLAGSFRFTADQIDSAVAAARSQARLQAGSTPGIADVFSNARTQSTGNLGSLARRIEPLYTWPDIVLPPDQMAQLREICSHARHRNIVFGNWGFDRKISYGKGLNVLFSGPPGTGKTMAAEIIANELKLGLYKIDLSQVVSKYIGETEKNLSRIFNEARMTNAIIFFDEADALFGKRSEVRDAHDRYANIEISYLLQKMEEYDGISILATNLRQNLDQAFTRRLSFSIDFPFPDEASRLLIWRSIWPPETPVAADLDLPFVATQYKLSGGSVKNIALAASFMAVEENAAAVSTPHLLRAVRREFQKMGKSMQKAEFGPYHDRLEISA